MLVDCRDIEQVAAKEGGDEAQVGAYLHREFQWRLGLPFTMRTGAYIVYLLLRLLPPWGSHSSESFTAFPEALKRIKRKDFRRKRGN